MPLHWIYDVDKVAGLVESEGRAGAPEFFPKPSCPFYEYPLGALSPYGDEELAVLQYGAAHPDIDGPGLMEHLVGYFSAYQGRLNSTANKLLEGWAAGQRYPTAAADDSQAHAIVKVPVLVARYGGTPELGARVEAAVRSQQNNDTAVAIGQAAAAILERIVVEGSSVGEAVTWALQPGSVAAEVQAELAPFLQQDDPGAAPTVREMVWDVTKAPHCGLPGALINALYCAQTSSGYQDNVRRNLEAAGDNCSRVLYGGALWAAAEGEGALPAAWKAQVAAGKWEEIEALVDALLSHRGA